MAKTSKKNKRTILAETTSYRNGIASDHPSNLLERPVGPGSAPLRELTRNGAIKLFSDPNSPVFDALSELRSKGYIRELGGRINIETKCEQLIGGLNFAIVGSQELSPGIANMKNFSLIGSTNVDETIMNSKILDPDLDKLTPVPVSAVEKIKNQTDTFYELDEERPESIKIIFEKEKLIHRKKAIRVAKDLSEIVRLSPNKMLDKEINRSFRS